MIINHNMASLNTYRQLSTNNANSAKSLEKLSSGLRINKAGDDAAGLAISEKMRGQIRGLDQAGRNSQDAISLIQTAEGGLTETHSILQRMRELSVQAANDTLNSDDRGNIQEEMNQLRQEVDRISTTTEFNTKKLLNGDISKTVAFSGANAAKFDANAYSTTGSTTAGVYTVTITNKATQATVAGAANGGTDDVLDATTVVNGAATVNAAAVGTLTVNGKALTIGASDTLDDVVTKINALNADTGVKASIGTNTDSASAAKSFIQLKSDNYGSDATIQVSGTAAQLQALGIQDDTATNTVISDAGTDAIATISGGSTLQSAEGNKVTFSNGLTVKAVDSTIADTNAVTVSVNAGNAVEFQIGANEDQHLNLAINKMDATSLGIAGSTSTEALSVSNYANSKSAITTIDAAIKKVSNERSNLGAYQNRLEHTIANLGTSSENLTAAESRVRDVDMAKEMMQFQKNNILSQAAQAMLAQANQAPQGVLQLLR